MGTDWVRIVCNVCQARIIVAAAEAPPLSCPDCGTYASLVGPEETTTAALAVRPGTPPAAPSFWDDLKQAAVAAAPHVARGFAIVGAEVLRHRVREAAEQRKANIQSDHQWTAVGEIARNVGPAVAAGAAVGGSVGYLTGGAVGAVKGAVKMGHGGVKAVLQEYPDAIQGPLRRHREQAAVETRNVDGLAGCADALLRAVQVFAASGTREATPSASGVGYPGDPGVRVMRTNVDTHSKDGLCTGCGQADEVTAIESCRDWYWCNRCGKSFESDVAPGCAR